MTDIEADVTDDDLQAYFDGELEGPKADRIARAVRGSADLEARLTQMRSIAEALTVSLDGAAARVPEARFEQIWDDIDSVLDREQRLQDAAEVHGSIWSKVSAFFRPLRIPLAAAGAVAAVTAIIIAMPGDDDKMAGNNSPQAASTPEVEQAGPPAPAKPVKPQTKPTSPTKVADAAPAGDEPEGWADPDSNDAEIQKIEFGGKMGRIGQIEGRRGTTTVIWVTEEEPVDSERSL